MKAKPIANDCKRYTHEPGYPYPKVSDSCRGCKYSYDPALYDAGCPYGPLLRDEAVERIGKQKGLLKVWMERNVRKSASHPIG